MVRARLVVEGAGVCLQLPRGDIVTLCGCWSGRDSGERTQQEALADRTGASWRGRSVGRMAAGCRRRQAGSGKARNRARARSNWASQGQRCGRCSVRRRAERVIRGRKPIRSIAKAGPVTLQTDTPIGLSGPLTPNVPVDVTLVKVMESSRSVPVLLYDEILVRRNLPSATNLVFEDTRRA